ncbi:DUF4198 domain-containing protein [Spirosoma linguale]|uniref:Nickel transport complex, NikM subunit, transmembrane n=1 Tax=Spirosoma linguale (strain ATCC 33905 / DSM 74 / LMG 10896 / Claus 1) TaxID=504472 RepID=D2QVA8_SPILD|nr:Nickel transport complex, NikM subunit, transmembrane [Spirosoma linguale DSM 74]
MKKTIASLLFLFLPLLTQAHSYWLELKGSGKVGELMTVQCYFGELENGLREKADKLAGIKAFTASVLLPDGSTQPLTLAPVENCYQAPFTPGMAGTYQVLLVNDTRAVQDWTSHKMGIVRPREYLRAVCQVGGGSLSAKPVYYLDVTPQTRLAAGQPATLLVTKDGAAYANAPLKLTTPDGKQTKQTTDANGRLTLTPTGAGQYVVDVDFMDKIPGQYQGKAYQAVRNKTALTMVVN